MTVEETRALQETWAEVEGLSQEQEMTARRIEEVANEQAELRQALVDASTGKARKAALDALAPILTEAAVLPDEAVMRADRYARALHTWAGLGMDQIGAIEEAGKHEIKAVYEAASTDERAAEENEEESDRTAISIRVSHETRRIERRVREEVMPLQRLLAERLREVFDVRSIGHVEKGMIGEIDGDGRLHGHERFLLKTRERAQGRLQ